MQVSILTYICSLIPFSGTTIAEHRGVHWITKVNIFRKVNIYGLTRFLIVLIDNKQYCFMQFTWNTT